MSLDISNHSYIVQRERDAAFVAHFSNLRAAAKHVIQQQEPCCMVTAGGTFDVYECHKILNVKDEQPA